MIDREEKIESKKRLAKEQKKQAVKDEAELARSQPRSQGTRTRERAKFEKALKKAVLKDPIGSAEKLARLELTLAKLRRSSLVDEESVLKIENIAREIEFLRKHISG